MEVGGPWAYTITNILPEGVKGVWWSDLVNSGTHLIEVGGPLGLTHHLPLPPLLLLLVLHLSVCPPLSNKAFRKPESSNRKRCPPATPPHPHKQHMSQLYARLVLGSGQTPGPDRTIQWEGGTPTRLVVVGPCEAKIREAKLRQSVSTKTPAPLETAGARFHEGIPGPPEGEQNPPKWVVHPEANMGQPIQ